MTKTKSGSRLALGAMMLAIGLLAAAPQAALAREKGDRLAAPAATTDYAAQDAQEAADGQIVLAAIQAMVEKRAAGLKPRLPQIRAVLARAPASYPLIEQRDDVIIVRDEDPRRALAAAGITDTGGRRVEQRFNTYIFAAYILGWYANEVRKPEDALEPLAKGLALQPGSPRLTSEQNAALVVLRRFPEALAANDVALAQPGLDDEMRARLMRNRGYVLIELNRLDEAEAAYKESLRLAPGNDGALGELEFIRRKRAGEPVSNGMVLMTGDQPTPGENPSPDDKK